MHSPHMTTSHPGPAGMNDAEFLDYLRKVNEQLTEVLDIDVEARLAELQRSMGWPAGDDPRPLLR
jgi:hypothetical protein